MSMTTKKVQAQIDSLIDENNKLKEQLAELNENTVITSMNDMKKQYEELKMNTVDIEQFLDVQLDAKRYLYLLKTVENINMLVVGEMMNLTEFVKRCDLNEISPENKHRRISVGLTEMRDRIMLIQELIDKQTDDGCPHC